MNERKVRKTAAAVLCAVMLVLSGTACQGTPGTAVPAAPILVFSEQPVTWETDAGTFSGRLSRDPQQRAVLIFTEPERLAGLTFLSEQTGEKLQYEGLSAGVSVLPGPVGQVLEALYAASLPESLLLTEEGFMGTLPDGTAFSLETDGAGALLSVTVPGIQMRFEREDGAESAAAREE